MHKWKMLIYFCYTFCYLRTLMVLSIRSTPVVRHLNESSQTLMLLKYVPSFSAFFNWRYFVRCGAVISSSIDKIFRIGESVLNSFCSLAMSQNNRSKHWFVSTNSMSRKISLNCRWITFRSTNKSWSICWNNNHYKKCVTPAYAFLNV